MAYPLLITKTNHYSTSQKNLWLSPRDHQAGIIASPEVLLASVDNNDQGVHQKM